MLWPGRIIHNKIFIMDREFRSSLQRMPACAHFSHAERIGLCLKLKWHYFQTSFDMQVDFVCVFFFRSDVPLPAKSFKLILCQTCVKFIKYYLWETYDFVIGIRELNAVSGHI